MKRLFSPLALVFVAFLAAGCTTGGVLPGVPQTASDIPIAFEPITGIPEARAAVLAEALATQAIERKLSVVPRNGADARFRIKGYFSASRTRNTTMVAYVWDIADASGRRVHRVSGAEALSAGLPDPWQAVTDDALREIARRTVTDLAAWLDRGAPATTERVAGSPSPAAAE